VEGVVDALEREILDRSEGEISTLDIGAEVMRRLRALDEVAYVRFASVYREYQALEEFIQEIQTFGADLAGNRAGTEPAGRIGPEAEAPAAGESGGESAKPLS
jgi:transcriptional repressor NrdR